MIIYSRTVAASVVATVVITDFCYYTFVVCYGSLPVIANLNFLTVHALMKVDS